MVTTIVKEIHWISA